MDKVAHFFSLPTYNRLLTAADPITPSPLLFNTACPPLNSYLDVSASCKHDCTFQTWLQSFNSVHVAQTIYIQTTLKDWWYLMLTFELFETTTQHFSFCSLSSLSSSASDDGVSIFNSSWSNTRDKTFLKKSLLFLILGDEHSSLWSSLIANGRLSFSAVDVPNV